MKKKIYISHSGYYDYVNELYNPLKESVVFKDYEAFYPHEGKFFNTKDIMSTFDLMIADVSKPSTGQGVEIGRAECSNVPILCIYKKGSKISSALKLITNNFIEYTDVKDMINKLENFILKNYST